jgi:hypothetical protein
MLQRAAAAKTEMRARRIGAPFAPGQPLDDPALAPPASAGAESRSHAIARHSKGEKDRLAPVLRDAVSLRAEAFDQKLDQLIGASLVPSTRSRHYRSLIGVYA